jgi:Tol biopolymer transport system component
MRTGRRYAPVAAVLLLTGCGGGAVRLPSAARAPRARVARNGEITFIRRGTVYAIRPDGTGRRRIAGSSDSGPTFSELAWSPDGRRLAATTTGGSLVLLRPGGSRRRLLLRSSIHLAEPGVFFRHPSWAPSGDMLAVVRVEGTIALWSDAVELVPTAGGRPVTLVKDAGFPTWRRDGRVLVYEQLGRHSPFQTTGPMRDSVHALDARGDREVARDLREPAVSPDGRLVAAVEDDSGLVILRAEDGRIRTRLPTRGRFDYEYPAWSPDGRFVVVNRAYGTHSKATCCRFELWLVRRDGTGARLLVRRTDGEPPAWRPRPG